MSDVERVWITGYALNRGIEEHAVEECITTDEGRTYVRVRPGGVWFQLGAYAFATRAEAAVDAERRRQKKIEALRNELARLEAMSFVPEE